jgi:valyl-tRNA synthetase
VLSQGFAPPHAVNHAIDKALLANLALVVEDATAAFEAFNYTKALEVTEQFFWSFCDDHVELVKDRAYGLAGEEAAASARAALNIALETLLKLFAPFLPFVTEEVWSWWQDGSVHHSTWPTSSALNAVIGDGSEVQIELVSLAADAISQLRKVKSEAKVSMKAGLEQVTISANAAHIALLRQVEVDLVAAGRIAGDITYTTTDAALEVAANIVAAE